MFNPLSTAAQKSLWPHQAEAVNFAIGHLDVLDTPCLIRMPTGTGKTGVIACLTRLSNQGSSLVLTPWAHLRNQMVFHLEEAFWKKVGLTPKDFDIVPIFPSTAASAINTSKRKVIVATFATLNELRSNYLGIYQDLAQAISLVIVDEGHYEPAVEWGKSVKGLKTKTLLLTATPYRNDLKLFRITDASASTHHFTHRQAVDDEIIRDVTFDELNATTAIPSLCVAFAKRWKALKRAKALASSTPRAIICCGTDEDIEATVAHLQDLHVNAIGIHEQFARSDDVNLRKPVPDPGVETADVWIHQNKLTEGLDDDRFCCLALFTRIGNDRKLIQQIGRILRRGIGDISKTALVLTPPELSVENEWKAYRDFETNLRLLEPTHFREVVDKLLQAQPDVEYFEGRFRQRFAPEQISSKPQVIIPASVLVRKADSDFSLDEYIEDCTDTLNTEDAVILGPQVNGPCQRNETFALWIYASIRNSRLLQYTSLYEIKLETHCVVIANGYVLISDSRGLIPTEYLEGRTNGVPPSQLMRFLDRRFRLTQVSVSSSIPYDTVVRGAELRGHDLANIPASLTDRVQICRSARGSARGRGRRYLGLNTGRLRKEVTREERRLFDLNKFVDWAADVSMVLESTASASAVFERFMPTCRPPTNPIPKSLCIDLLPLDANLALADGRECRLRSSSTSINQHDSGNTSAYACSFSLEGKTVPKLASINLVLEYQASKRRFWFRKGTKSAQVHVEIEGDDGKSNKSFAEFLNQRQDAILIGLEGGQIVYQGRNFYEIDYSYAERTLIDLIERGDCSCATEKGSKEELQNAKKTLAKKFPKNSIFRAIADSRIRFPFDDDLLICGDMGTECADFVAANFEKRQLALIHAKVGSGTKISASAFHDVVAQAMKNLAYMTVNSEIPKGVSSWRTDKMWNRTGISRLYRVPEGVPSGKSLWSKIKSDIVGSSNPQLYLVLVTAGCCNTEDLKRAVRDPDRRTPEVAQLLHLLDGLSGYTRSLGIRLLIYDLPHG